MKKIKSFFYIIFVLTIILIIISFLLSFKIDKDFKKEIENNYSFINEKIYIICKYDYNLLDNKKNINSLLDLFIIKTKDIDKYCNICGEKTEDVGIINYKEIKCNFCKNLNSGKVDFCSNCGEKLKKSKVYNLDNLNKYYKQFEQYRENVHKIYLTILISIFSLIVSGIIIIVLNRRTLSN